MKKGDSYYEHYVKGRLPLVESLGLEIIDGGFYAVDAEELEKALQKHNRVALKFHRQNVKLIKSTRKMVESLRKHLDSVWGGE